MVTDFKLEKVWASELALRHKTLSATFLCGDCFTIFLSVQGESRWWCRLRFQSIGKFFRINLLQIRYVNSIPNHRYNLHFVEFQDRCIDFQWDKNYSHGVPRSFDEELNDHDDFWQVRALTIWHFTVGTPLKEVYERCSLLLIRR